MSKTIVIGGGIVGASAAYHLAKAGASTLLIDRRDPGQATTAGAGIVSPGTSLKAGPEVLAYSATAVRHYADLVAELATIGQDNTGYEVVGELLCARTDEEAGRIPAMFELYTQRWKSGMPNMEKVELVDAAQAKSMFPALLDVPAAIHIAGAARVDGGLMRDALLGGAAHHGAEIRHGDVSILVENDTVTGVVLDEEMIAADSIVIAAGAWTNPLLAPLGANIGVEPQRGQILHLTMPDQDTSRWAIIQKLSDQYILTFGPNRVVVGATREFGSGFDYRLTVGGTQSVLNEALSVAPGLAEGTIAEWRIGFRPYSNDGLPYLGMIPGYANVVVATGLGPSGLTLGPYSGLAAAQLALGEPVSVDLRAFAVNRPVS
jgi:D-amino-acid dehydrogenase